MESNETNIEQERSPVQYIGFWKRVMATFTDTIIWLLISVPIMLSVYGVGYFHSDEYAQGWVDVLINQVLPIVLVIFLWLRYAATPGKMIFHAVIVDAKTFGPMSVQQAIIRYLGYIPSLLVLGLGFLWAAFDERKQTWHDKLAKTVVIKRNELD